VKTAIGFSIQRRRQFCALCGQLMFEYFGSPDGHFGLVDSLAQSAKNGGGHETSCLTCGTRYRFLDRLNAKRAPIERM